MRHFLVSETEAEMAGNEPITPEEEVLLLRAEIRALRSDREFWKAVAKSFPGWQGAVSRMLDRAPTGSRKTKRRTA